MKKERTKGFISGLIVATLIFGITVTGFAATGSQAITVGYNNIKVYIDDVLTEMKDPNGKAVEPFIYDGTTYVPLRAVGEAFGKEVKWDNDTKSIYIGKQIEKVEAPAPSATPTEQIIMDKNGVKISYLGNEKNGSKYNIKLKIENSSSKNYTVQVRDFSINGIMCSKVFSCDVAAGKTAIDGISVYESALKDIGQSSISSAEFYFSVFNSDDWSDDFESDIIKL